MKIYKEMYRCRQKGRNDKVMQMESKLFIMTADIKVTARTCKQTKAAIITTE